MAGDRLDGGPVEQVGAVLDRATQLAVRSGGRAEGDGEVELGRRRTGGEQLALQARDVHGGSGLVHHQGDLEQRVAAGGALRVDQFDDPLERQVLVGVGGQVGVPHPEQQFAEARVAVGVGAQHQGVDEEADQVVEGLVGAAGDRGADRDVGARAEAGEQRRETGLDGHEEAGAVRPGERRQGPVVLGGQPQRDVAGLRTGLGGAAPVHGQGDLLGQAGQGLAPVLPLAGGRAGRVPVVSEEGELPLGVVGVLDGQVGPLGRPAGRPGPVGGAQVAGERAQRPAVAGDVVDRQQQDVPVGREGEEVGAQRRLGGEVEGPGGGGAQRLSQLLLAHPGGVDTAQQRGQPVRVVDQLPGALCVGGEHGAQGLVADGAVAQGLGERVGVEVAAQVQGERNVVGVAQRVQLLQEPEPALGVRERDPLGPGGGGQHGATPVGVHEAGQSGGGGALEDRSDGQFGAQGGAHPADQPGGQQRVPAEREEVVVGADRGDAEDLGEQRAERGLAGVPGSPGRAGGGAQPGLGKGRTVQLAAGVERQPVEYGVRRRDHVVGQPARQQFAHLGEVGGVAVLGHQVGGQVAFLGAVAAGQDGGLEDGGVAQQHRLDLAGLDPEAADLDLPVGPAEVLHLAVAAHPGEVAGAVHPGPGRAVRVGDEALGGQAGAAQVAAGQVRPGQVQLAGHAERDGAQPLVQHLGAGVVEGAADDRGRAVRQVAGERVDGALGRSVVVEHRDVGQGGELGPQRRADGLAAEHQHRRPVLALGEQTGRGERRDVGRGEVEEVQALAADVVDQGLGVEPDLVAQQVQRVALQQPEQRLPGGVEGDRGDQAELEAPASGAAGRPDHPGAVVLHQAAEAAVRDHHALGDAGRPGGVDDVGRVERAGGAGAVGVGQVAAGVGGDGGADLGLVQEQDGRGGRQPPGVRDGGQHADRVGVREDGGQPLARRGGADRDVGGARLEHGEQGDQQVGGARQRQHDVLLGAGPAPHELPGEPVGPLVDLGEGEPAVLRDEGGDLALQRGALLEGGVVGDGGGGQGGPGGAFQEVQPVVGGEQVVGADRLVRVGGDRGEQPAEPDGQGLGAGPGEQVGAVLDEAAEPGGGAVGVVQLPDVEGQVELGAARARLGDLGLDAGQGEARLGGVLEGQHDLEQRVPGQRPVRIERGDQPLEGELLVGEALEVGAAHPLEQLAEGRVAGGVQAQDQRVDEIADDLVVALVGAPGDRAGDRDVRTGPGAGQCGGQCGLEHHEHADPAGAGQGEQLAVQLGREVPGEELAPVRHRGRPRVVGGQFQEVRQARQGLAPVGELAAAAALRVVQVAEVRVLAHGVLGVRGGQRGPDRCPALPPGQVRGAEVAGQRGHRPAVTGDVVQHHLDHVLARAEREQPHPQRHFRLQVEDVPGLGPDQGGQLRLGGGHHGEHRGHLGHRQHVLARHAVPLGEHGAQGRVPLQHVVQRGPERLVVDLAGQPQGHRDVVRGVPALETVVEPERQLRVRQRCFRGQAVFAQHRASLQVNPSRGPGGPGGTDGGCPVALGRWGPPTSIGGVLPHAARGSGGPAIGQVGLVLLVAAAVVAVHRDEAVPLVEGAGPGVPLEDVQ